MPAESLTTEDLLLVVDLALAAASIVGFTALSRARPPAMSNPLEAFQVLDRSIEKFVPNLPLGFTWGEAVERLKQSGVKLDWGRFETSLNEYEAFRYGGHQMPKGLEPEVVRLATTLRRNVVGYRNKRKGPGSS
jgi:hypothetical protein